MVTATHFRHCPKGLEEAHIAVVVVEYACAVQATSILLPCTFPPPPDHPAQCQPEHSSYIHVATVVPYMPPPLGAMKLPHVVVTTVLLVLVVAVVVVVVLVVVVVVLDVVVLLVVVVVGVLVVVVVVVPDLVQDTVNVT